MIQRSVTDPKIAIIVPVYNVECYIAECLESICNQTYTNWECFIVDDGAMDASGKIAEEYALKDNRFKVFHIQNSGLGAARNYALDRLEEISPTSDYVAFVDSDDVIDKSMYLKLVNVILQDNTDVAICGFYNYLKSGIQNNHCVAKHEIISNEDFVELVFELGKWKNHPCSKGMVWKSLIRYDFLHDLRFPIDRGLCEDEPFDLLLASKIKKITLLPEALYGYRKRTGSLIRAKNFNIALLRGRKMCVEIANTISRQASLVASAAYINTLLKLVKDYKLSVDDDLLKIDLSEQILEELVCEGLIKKKNACLLRFIEKRNKIAPLYLWARRKFHQFQNRTKGNEGDYFL